MWGWGQLVTREYFLSILGTCNFDNTECLCLWACRMYPLHVPSAQTHCLLLTPIQSLGVCVWVVITNFSLSLTLCWNTHKWRKWMSSNIHPSIPQEAAVSLEVFAEQCRSLIGLGTSLLTAGNKGMRQMWRLFFLICHFKLIESQFCLLKLRLNETNFFSTVSDFQDNHSNKVASLWRFKLTV